MLFVPIGQKVMQLENDIRNILFQIGKEIKLHRIDSENMVIDINYEKYVKELIELFDRQTR
jgi:hypothetical protein